MRWLGRLACLGVSVLVLGWILHRVHAPTLGRTLAEAKLLWIAAAWGAFGAALGLAAARWHLVLQLSRAQVHAMATWRTVLIGHLFNTVLFGPTGGDLAKSAYYARQYRFPTPRVLASCFLDRSLGGVGFLIFAVCTPGFSLYAGHWSDRLGHWVSSPRLLLGAGIALALLVGLFFLRHRINWATPLRALSGAFVSNGILLLQPRKAIRGVVCAVCAHLCISAVFLCCLQAVTDTRFSMAALFWVFPIISLITSAPVTFSGAGLREGAALFFLGMYGIPAEDAVAASLLVLFTHLTWAAVAGLVLWRDRSEQKAIPSLRPAQSISIVIPTLHEAEVLPATLEKVRQIPEVTEVIVADGGSVDGTADLAAALGCQVIQAPLGRGSQLRAGAATARGDVVVMLHADTWLPPEAGWVLLNCLRDPCVVGGAFWKTFRERNWLLSGSRFRCALRLLLFRRVMGDQVIFARRTVLEQIGGIPAVPLMEEFELCRRLRKAGRLALAGATVTTSARRFVKHGIVRTYWRMAHITLRYYLGSAPKELREIYERD